MIPLLYLKMPSRLIIWNISPKSDPYVIEGNFPYSITHPLHFLGGEETEMDLENSLLYIWNYIQNIYLFMICAIT